MRVVFAGTPAFAAKALEAIAASAHAVALVLTQPDRPAGRGLRLTPSAVSVAAERLGIPVDKPASLRQGECAARLRGLSPDVIVVAAYGLLLPKDILAIPARGCLNIHASLLPRWRGAAPIHRALLAGDKRTGITIMQMDAGLDTGPVLLERPMAIGERDTTGTLTERLAQLGAQAIVDVLDRLDTLTPKPQDAGLATYAAKVGKAEARIDWTQPNTDIDRQIRAFDPVPGAEGRLGDDVLKVWTAQPVPGPAGVPGEIVAQTSADLVVACGQGALRLLVVQRPGGRRMTAGEYWRGKSLRSDIGGKS